MVATEKFDQVAVQSQEELRAWLMTHHGQAESVWLVTFKKSVPAKYLYRWMRVLASLSLKTRAFS